jgi:hypothetical protein
MQRVTSSLPSACFLTHLLPCSPNLSDMCSSLPWCVLLWHQSMQSSVGSYKLWARSCKHWDGK